jgi:hypothetical protein
MQSTPSKRTLSRHLEATRWKYGSSALVHNLWVLLRSTPGSGSSAVPSCHTPLHPPFPCTGHWAGQSGSRFQLGEHKHPSQAGQDSSPEGTSRSCQVTTNSSKARCHSQERGHTNSKRMSQFLSRSSDLPLEPRDLQHPTHTSTSAAEMLLGSPSHTCDCHKKLQHESLWP